MSALGFLMASPVDDMAWPDAPCCLKPQADDPLFPYLGGCVCMPAERVLRGWIGGADVPPMTAEQREWCLVEIEQAEGYRRSDHETESDADLANTVLSAWVDYCRDKGML